MAYWAKTRLSSLETCRQSRARADETSSRRYHYAKLSGLGALCRNCRAARRSLCRHRPWIGLILLIVFDLRLVSLRFDWGQHRIHGVRGSLDIGADALATFVFTHVDECYPITATLPFGRHGGKIGDQNVVERR
jgi:hypothetical protein